MEIKFCTQGKSVFSGFLHQHSSWHNKSTTLALLIWREETQKNKTKPWTIHTLLEKDQWRKEVSIKSQRILEEMLVSTVPGAPCGQWPSGDNIPGKKDLCPSGTKLLLCPPHHLKKSQHSPTVSLLWHWLQILQDLYFISFYLLKRTALQAASGHQKLPGSTLGEPLIQVLSGTRTWWRSYHELSSSLPHSPSSPPVHSHKHIRAGGDTLKMSLISWS